MISQNFLIEMLSSKGGGVSSKRTILVFFVLLFAFCVVYNMITGHAPDNLYKEQVFEALLVCIGAVFGERVVDILPTIRGKKSTTSVTTITPEPQSVTTVTNVKEPEAKQ